MYTDTILEQFQPTVAKRDLVASRLTYERHCEDCLDYYLSGAAQRLHLQGELARRLGEVAEPRELATDTSNRYASTDSGRVIREGRVELVTAPLLRAVIDSIAVLYAADDLERTYSIDGELHEDTARVMARYHRDASLPAICHQLDALVCLLRTACQLVRWSPRGGMTYANLPAHWVHVYSSAEWPLDPSQAVAIAYAEAAGSNVNRWCTYVRPAHDGEAENEIHASYPEGALLRYERRGSPFPVPAPGDRSVIEAVENPIVAIGGMARGLWSPLVWCWAEPPLEDVFLPPQHDLVRANLELDCSLSLLAYVANLQSAGQPVITGSASLPPALGPSCVVQIDDPAGRFEYVAPKADLAGHIETITRLVSVQSALRHLAPDQYSTTRPSVQTGPAKLLEQAGLVESRWRRTLQADQWERQRFDLERLLHNAHGRGPRIPDDVELAVRWGELRVPIDRNAQVARIAQEIALGVSSRVDAAMEILGVDRTTAERHLARVDSANVGPASATGDQSSIVHEGREE